MNLFFVPISHYGPIDFSMRNIKLVLSYDGTDFSGWQRQPDRRTIQQELEDAIARITGTLPNCSANGRTDGHLPPRCASIPYCTCGNDWRRIR